MSSKTCRMSCGRLRAVAEIDSPYLNFAVICEKVLQEADGVLSFIRLIDHLTVTMTIPAGADVPQEAVPPEPPVVVTFALGLKSPSDIGPVPVKVRIETPSGLSLPEFETSQPVGAEDRGINIVLPMQFPAQDEGVYWFAVEVSGTVITRIPLRISKQIVPQDMPPQAQ
jgi:hypothetical protein